jgi:hypothetical protein
MLMLVDFIVEDVVNIDNVVNSICRLKHILQLAYTKCSLSIFTTTYCKNSDVLFAALWTKLSILSQNRGNL